MRPKVILHIGVNKTGTSSIQHHFITNRPTFWKAGVYYPGMGQKAPAQHLLLDWIREPEKYSEKLATLRDEMMTQFRVTLLSSEALVDLHDPRKLANWLKGFDVEVVVYLRDPTRYCISWWQQDIQGGDAPHDIRFYLLNKRRSFTALLGRWCEAFGRSKVNVRLYDRDALPDGDVLTDFLRCTGLDEIEGQKRTPWESNPSISGNLLYFKYLYNSLGIPDARSWPMMGGLTEATKLDWRWRCAPKVDDYLIGKNREIYSEEIAEIERDYGIAIKPSEPSKVIDVPQVDQLKADFDKLKNHFLKPGKKEFPLMDLEKHMQFV